MWWTTFVVVALLHGLFAVFIVHEMQPRLRIWRQQTQQDTVLQVRFIERTAAPTSEPAPPPMKAPPAGRPTPEGNQPMPRRAVKPSKTRPERSEAMTARIEPPASAASTSAPAPKLYNKTGGIVLPPAAKQQKPVPDYVQHVPKDDARIMQHTSPIPDRTTSLNKYFPPPDETAAGALGRKVMNAVQGDGPGTKTVDLPGGTHLKCKTVFGVPTPFCHDPPPPPPSNDDDERLNLPSAPLAADPHPKPKPPLALCIKQYRARSGLSQGCPLNTPDLAYKAELAQCIGLYRAGKRLKSWCPADIAKRAAEAPPASASTAPALPDIEPGVPEPPAEGGD